jgi:8-oxo-dGTP pyrophosphatase MutT (NUDIX family)
MPKDKPLQLLSSRLGEDPGTAARELPQAAVLVLLDSLHEEPQVLLSRRADHLRLHAGEVAFPGGKCDLEDRDHWATALRESEEEIGLDGADIQRLGTMAPLVTRTGIEVTPCVAVLERAVEFRLNPEEIDSLFQVPLSYLAQSEALVFDTFEYGGRERRVPRYEWKEYSIWGITAAILVRLVNLSCDAGLEMQDYWKGGTRE